MSSEQQQLEAGILALESQRGLLGDAVVDAMQAAARSKLAALAAVPAASSAAAQALKQVSILFLDVVGSTTLSQHLDPEDISAVMDDALQRGHRHRRRRTAARCCSTLATTSSPPSAPTSSREDDAERAVRCGLALARARQGARRRGAGGARPRGLRRSRRHPHRRRAARRRRRCRRHDPRHRREHRRAHGADRPGRAPCASATTPTRRCAACSRSSRRSRSRQGHRRADPELPRAAREAALLSHRRARHRRRCHSHDRP